MFLKYPDIMSVADVQKALGIGESKVRELLRSGEIKHWRIGILYKIPKQYLIDYVEALCYNGYTTESSPSEGGSSNGGECKSNSL